MKQLLVLSVLPILLVVGCAVPSPQRMQNETVVGATMAQGGDQYIAQFIYNTPKQGPVVPVNVTYTVLRTTYKNSEGLMWFTAPQFANFSGAIEEDLLKILTVKGFSVRGPYESYDLIPFQDRKVIDLLLLPTVEFSVVLKDHKEQAANMWQPAADQIQTGNAEVKGRIVLKMEEIATKQLMWVKTIPFKNLMFPYFVKTTFKEYARIKKSKSDKLYSYDPIFNVMSRSVEEQYPDIMGTIDTLIDPEEMELIKKQCQELKSKKGY